MQFADCEGKCKCHGKCMHTYQKRLTKKRSQKQINCQDGFVFYDCTSDCMVYRCGKVKENLIDHTKIKPEDKEMLEDDGLIQYLGETKWALIENNKGSCGWEVVVPAITDKSVVARTTVRKNGKVKLRVSVHPSLGDKLTLEQRRKIGRLNEKKTAVHKMVIERNKIDEHILAYERWARENKR